ncbi:MAG: PqiC family protein [Oceanipulchritudo sp.]
MKHRTPLLLLSGILLLAGCADLDVFTPMPDASTFYILGRQGFENNPPARLEDGTAILVGPVRIAQHLEQPRIVSYGGANQLHYSDLHRWGEPLEEGVNRILLRRLSGELMTSRVTLSSVAPDLDWDYRIGYEVRELGGAPAEPVHLQVAWWVRTKNGGIASYQTTLQSDPLAKGSLDYAAYVWTIESLLSQWADEVAAAVRELPSGD